MIIIIGMLHLIITDVVETDDVDTLRVCYNQSRYNLLSGKGNHVKMIFCEDPGIEKKSLKCQLKRSLRRVN